jgi:hypothetical protein
MRVGLNFLQSLNALPYIAKNGVPIQIVFDYGATQRPGSDLSTLPDPIPLSVLLADHRAGDNSVFICPWCS